MKKKNSAIFKKKDVNEELCFSPIEYKVHPKDIKRHSAMPSSVLIPPCLLYLF
jgi:hypothetical protein